MARMKCSICGKPVKEDTEGNMKYCQGHRRSIFDPPEQMSIDGMTTKRHMMLLRQQRRGW